MEMNCTYETMTSWKKELVKRLKDWDKLYMNHIKKTYPEMNAIHQ
jgi:predicted small metal-binding protein